MPPAVYCNGCNETFTSFQYFQQHINANVHCYETFMYSKRTDSGLRRSTPQRRAWKRSGLSIEEFQPHCVREFQAEEARRTKGMNNVDYSQFDFTDNEENAAQQRRIRVGILESNVGERTVHRPRAYDEALVDSPEGNNGLGEDSNIFALENATWEDSNVDGDATEGVVGVDVEVGTSGTGAAKSSNSGGEDSGPMAQFKECVERAKTHGSSLPKEMIAATELMHLMHKNGCSGKLYDALWEWHLDHLGVEKSVSRDKLYRRLMERHNLAPT